MIKLFTRLSHAINVYEGISPSLLATMSLSVNIKGSNHNELIENMVKAGLIQDQEEINAYKALDRQHFTSFKNPYGNKPYSISNRENMTDIFTHSVIISNLTQHWKNNLSILDIGTGHGYLSFLIAKILQNKTFHQYSIQGIDIHPQSIQTCEQLREKLMNGDKRITFKSIDSSEYLQTVKDGSLDMIIGGYFFQEKLTEKLIKKLSTNGVGIWPTLSQSGQALYKFSKNKEKVYLIETLFSMPVVRLQVSKYFIGEGAQQNGQDQHELQHKQVKTQMSLEKVKDIKKQMETKLREQLKCLMQKYRKPNGKLPNLKEMKQNPQINAKLVELEKLPKLKVKCSLK